jgi:membrane protein implicated in regulation of membrane protease activity
MKSLVTRFETGEIKLKGKYWTAITENGEEVNAGDNCTVIRFEGVKAIIRKS